MNTNLGTCMLDFIRPLSSKNKRLEAGFHLNNRQICPRKLHTLVHFFMNDTPTLALKRGLCVFQGSMSLLCFLLSFCLFGHTRDPNVSNEKAKCVCFIYIQKQK